jgi:hypothetical protein
MATNGIATKSSRRVLVSVLLLVIVGIYFFPFSRVISGFRYGWVYVPTCMQMTIDSGATSLSESTSAIAKIIDRLKVRDKLALPSDMMHIRGEYATVTWTGPANPVVTICTLGDYEKWKSLTLLLEANLRESFVLKTARLQLNPELHKGTSPLDFEVSVPLDFRRLEETVFVDRAEGPQGRRGK